MAATGAPAPSEGGLEPYAGAPAKVVSPAGGYLRPSIARVVTLAAGPPAQLPLLSFDADVHVHMSIAFVTLTATYRADQSVEGPAIFELPTNNRTTVNGVDIVLDNGKAFASEVVSTETADAAKEDAGSTDAMTMYYEHVGGTYSSAAFDPDVFRVPMSGVPPGSIVSVRAQYFTNLEFSEGSYILTVPTTVQPQVFAGESLSQAVTVTCELNTGTRDSSWEGTTHRMLKLEDGPGRVVLESDKAPGAQPNSDFTISYKAWSPHILCNLQIQPDPSNRSGSFTLFVAPPPVETIASSADASFGRRVVFLIDNSGSMTGKPMENAKRGLIAGLQQLQPHDFFAICVFNHEQEWWNPGGAGAGGMPTEDVYMGSAKSNPYDDIGQRAALQRPEGLQMVRATPENVGEASAFASRITTSGMTNILGPVSQSTELLQEAAANPACANTIPVVFLLTDGAVANERDICMFISDHNSTAPVPVRMFTFGIGIYCNSYFLRMLAQLGRGYNDINVNGENLEGDIASLMQKSSYPVLTDVELLMALENVEVYPFPIPDLFCGAPVIVSGKYTGVFPKHIQVRGKLPSSGAAGIIAGEAAVKGGGARVTLDAATGQATWVTAVQTTLSTHIPVNMVFAKQRLDLLIAKDWLLGGKDPELKNTVVEASIESSMPCPYTSMVLYPTTAQEVNGWRDADKKADSGDAGARAAPKKRKGLTKKTVAALAGVAVLGGAVAAVAAFGDVGLSAGGNGLLDGGFGGFGIGDFGGGFEVPPCCACFGDAECAQFCEGHEGALDLCFGNCGDCFGECGNACTTGFAEVGQGCSSCFTQCAACNPGDALGDLCGGLSQGICGGIGSCMNTCGDCTAGCANGYGDFCQNTDCGSLFASCTLPCAGLGGCFDGISDCVGGGMEGISACFGECAGSGGDICGECADSLNGILG